MAITTAIDKSKQRAGKKGKTASPAFSDWFRNLDLSIHLRKKITTREVLFFINQLALMIEMGSPLNTSLSLIVNQVSNPELKDVINSILNDVEEGKSLSEAFRRHPDIFPAEYISLVSAGENSGNLKTMLDRIVELQEKREKLVGIFKGALTYPAVLSVVIFGVVIFMLTFVFPRFATLFKDIRDILPASTKLLMWLSEGLLSYWHVILLSVGILIIGSVAYVKSTQGRRKLSELLTSLPYLSDMYIKSFLAKMMRTLGFLMKSNVPLLDAIAIIRGGTRNNVCLHFIDLLSENVEKGRGVAPAFNESQMIPDIAKQMVKIGDESQNIDKVLLKLSDFYEGEIERRLNTASRIIEPVLMIFMGVIVGLIVISLILPIFKLSRAVH